MSQPDIGRLYALTHVLRPPHTELAQAQWALKMAEAEARMITSSKTQCVVIDHHHFVIEIYRYENQENWTLEVVDPDGTSHLWEQRFSDDEIALETAFREIGTAGAEAFMRRDNVIPFRKSQRS